jgi:hypothetical protein
VFVRSGALAAALVPMAMVPVAVAQSTLASPNTQSNVNRSGVTPSQSAPAETSAETLAVRLELDLPNGCGNLTGFVDRLRTRLDRIQFSEAGANRVVQARIEAASEDRYRATMTLRYPDGRSSSRIVDANSCEDALEALALITAVTLDPLSVASKEAPVDEQPDPAQAPRRAAEGSHAKTSDQRNTVVAATPSPKKTIQETALTQGTDERTGFGVGVAYTAFRGPAPGTLSGIEFSLGMAQRSRHALALSARLGLCYAMNSGVVAQGGIADFSLASVVLDLCPLQHTSAIVELRACGVVHAGLITAEGRATQDPESHRRPLLAFGSSAQLTWVAWNFLALPLRAHLAFPTNHDTFGFYPVAFYRIPVMSYNVTAGLEARFR